MSDKEILLVYDRQCPVCDFYCCKVRIADNVGKLRLIDARATSDIMEAITVAGMDIDQGMVLKLEDQLYYGSDAIHVLALISNRSGVFNRLNYWLFSSRYLSRLVYPILRALRNLLLKLLGRSRINNLGIPGNDRF